MWDVIRNFITLIIIIIQETNDWNETNQKSTLQDVPKDNPEFIVHFSTFDWSLLREYLHE